MRFVSRLSVASVLSVPLFAQTTADVFDFDVTPAFRGMPGAHYAGWDAFTTPFGGTNAPDDPASDLSTTLEQLTPGAIITSTMNIYGPGGASSFLVDVSTGNDVLEVVLQVRTFATPLDANSVTLSYDDGGTVVSVAPTTAKVLNPAPGAAEETLFGFDLPASTATVTAFEVRFASTGAHCSLDALMLDVRTDSAVGTTYCTAVPNSTGVIGTTSIAGSPMASDNLITLTASDLPAATFGYFLCSVTQAQVASPGGSQGTLCLGGEIGRFTGNVFQTGVSGSHSHAVDLTQLPGPTGAVAASAGETWNFQCWHRDANPTATSNFTLPATVTLQ